MEEYFKQGDREKELGLPCSPLCDRDNTLIADSQIGEFFLDEKINKLRYFNGFKAFRSETNVSFVQRNSI